MRLIIASFVGAVIATGLVTLTSLYLPSADESYGAPISVGLSYFGLPFMRGETTFSRLLLGIDTLINWILWYALARWSGLVGIFAGIFGAFMSIFLITVMLSSQLPIVGVPIPFGRTPVPHALVMWLNLLAWTAAFAALSRIVRRRLRLLRASH
jgi:hypothetical protein